MDAVLIHLNKTGVRWKRRTRKRNKEWSFFLKKREQDIRCWRKSNTKREIHKSRFCWGGASESEEGGEKSRDGSE